MGEWCAKSGANEDGYGRFSTGILPSHILKRLIAAKREILADEDFVAAQIQPASIDLRLGPVAYRVRASFLPGPAATVEEKLASVVMHEIDLTSGAVLETGSVYIVPLLEHADFSARISGVTNPKSSTGRIDVFTRLITDRAQSFDRIEAGYRGPLYAEISPQSFPVLVRKGSRLNQLRIRHGSPQFSDTQLRRLHAETPLVDGRAEYRQWAWPFHRTCKGEWGRIGWRAKRHTGLIDVDKPAALNPHDFWESIEANSAGHLVLDPDEFYILVSREKRGHPARPCCRDGAVQPPGG